MSPILDERGGLSLSAGPSFCQRLEWPGTAHKFEPYNHGKQSRKCMRCLHVGCREDSDCFSRRRVGLSFLSARCIDMNSPWAPHCSNEARRAESSIISELTWGVGILQIGAEELRVTPGLAKHSVFFRCAVLSRLERSLSRELCASNS